MYCIERLVRALHEELRERLAPRSPAAKARRPDAATRPELIDGPGLAVRGRGYHIDVSHLSSVVQMSIHLPPGEELEPGPRAVRLRRRCRRAFSPRPIPLRGLPRLRRLPGDPGRGPR